MQPEQLAKVNHSSRQGEFTYACFISPSGNLGLKGRIKTNLSSLRNLLCSDLCELFNPFEDYFYNLSSYDKKTDLLFEVDKQDNQISPQTFLFFLDLNFWVTSEHSKAVE